MGKSLSCLYWLHPKTNQEYSYQVTEGGKNFKLTVNFETNDAIRAVKGYGYTATSTIISGKTVTFTKDSSSSFYVKSEPPQPFLIALGDSLRMLPPDVSAKGGITASAVASDGKAGELSDWLFNIDAEGDFGDLSYKVNADALKKSDNYYFKINNMPSVFMFGDLSLVKGKWISMTSRIATSTNNNYSQLSSLQQSLPKAEETYRANKQKFVNFIKMAVKVADEEGLIVFKNPPHSEWVG